MRNYVKSLKDVGRYWKAFFVDTRRVNDSDIPRSPQRSGALWRDYYAWYKPMRDYFNSRFKEILGDRCYLVGNFYSDYALDDMSHSGALDYGWEKPVKVFFLPRSFFVEHYSYLLTKDSGFVFLVF